MTKLITATKYILLLNLLIIPFLVCGYNEQAPFELIKLVVTAMLTILAACLFLISFIKKGEIKISWNFSLIFLGLIFLTTLISYFYSNNQFNSFWGNNNIPSDSLLTMIVYYLFSILLIQTIKNKEDLNKVNYALILSSFLLAGYGVVQHFGYDPVDWWGYSRMHLNAYGTIGQAVAFATILGTIFPLILMLYLNQKDNFLKNTLLVILFVVLLGIMYSGSRMPMVVTIALALLISIVYFIKIRTKEAAITAGKFVIILLLSQAIFYGEAKDNALTHKLQPKIISSGLDERIQVWQDAIKIWQKYPYLGAGPETFALELKQVNTKDFNSNQNWGLYWHKAHNQIIHYLATVGIVGLLSYLIFAFYIFFTIIKLVFKKYNDDDDYLKLGYLLGYAFVFVANFTAFNFITTQLYCFVLPTLYCITQFDSDKKTFTIRSPHFLNIINIVMSCVLLSLFAYEIFKFWNADRYFSTSRRYLEAERNMAKAIESIDKAIAIKDNDFRYYFRKASLITSFIKFQARSNPSAQFNFQAAVKDLENLANLGIKCDEDNPESWFFKGRLFADLYENRIINSIDIAEQSIIQGSKFSPANPVFPYQLGLLYLAAKRDVAFVNKMNEAIDLKYDYTLAYKALFNFYYKAKKQDEVDKLTARLLKTHYISGEFIRDLQGIVDLAISSQDYKNANLLKELHSKFYQIHLEIAK